LPAAGNRQSSTVPDLQALLHAAPQLRTLEADVFCINAAEAHRVLRNEPPFGPLRVRGLNIHAREATAEMVLALAADVAAHAWLARLWLRLAPLNTAAALDAVVDAALACRLASLRLSHCRLSPASAPALARLLGGDALEELHIENGRLLDAPAATLVANALRTSTSLTALLLNSNELFHNAAVAAELMGALTAHPRLRLLDLSYNRPHNGGMRAAEAGAALGALLLANAPALHTLDIGNCGLGHEGMGAVLAALRQNTHLTKLDCIENRVGAAFARNTLLPAVRANTSLRELVAARVWDGAGGVRDAEAVVAARARTQPGC
jgi:hypothetical protein